MTMTVDRPVASHDYAVPVPDAVLDRTAEALRANGMEVQVVADGDAAKAAVLALIPEGAEVNTGASRTLEDTGIKQEIEESGRYDAIRPRLFAMDRQTQMREIRKLGSAPDVWVNSAQAVTEDGHLVLGSFSGSQLGPIASGAGKVVFVVGAQKIVPDTTAAMHRLESYCLPLEKESAAAKYGISSAVNKALIVYGDFPGRTTVVLIREPIGF